VFLFVAAVLMGLLLRSLLWYASFASFLAAARSAAILCWLPNSFRKGDVAVLCFFGLFGCVVVVVCAPELLDEFPSSCCFALSCVSIFFLPVSCCYHIFVVSMPW